MIGTFTTTKFADRAAFNARRPSDVCVSRNAFVDVGLELMWSILIGGVRNDAGGLSDHLGKGRLIVGDGDTPVTRGDTRLAGENTAWAELVDGYPAIRRTDSGVMIVLQSVFGEDNANFDWRERGFTSVQGVLIDRSVDDQGRKAPGSIWTLEAQLELVA